jgi:hypothetical protein
VVRAESPFPYHLNLFNRKVTSAAICVSHKSRFEKPDKVGFVCRGSQRGGEYLGREDGRA